MLSVTVTVAKKWIFVYNLCARVRERLCVDLQVFSEGPTKISHCKYIEVDALCVGPSNYVSVPLNPCGLASRKLGLILFQS